MKYLFFVFAISLCNIFEASHAPTTVLQAHFYSHCLCSSLLPTVVQQNAEIKSNTDTCVLLNCMQFGLTLALSQDLDEKHNKLLRKIKNQQSLIVMEYQEVDRLKKKIDLLQNNLNHLKLGSPWLLVPSLFLGGMFIGYLCNDFKHYLFLKN